MKCLMLTGLLAMALNGAVRADAPPAPLIPMGAITGRPDENTVRDTLEAYKSVGIDQYLIYPRSGLETEYMSEEWLQLCEWFCRHAQRLGMKIWLYDEYNWPSGSCKGRVPKERPGYVYREFAVSRKADGTCTWRVQAAPGWVDSKSFNAIKRFIELTHDRYEKRLKPYFGNTVVGIFSDEPAYHVPIKFAEKPTLRFAYYDGAEEAYKQRVGRALRQDVEAYLADSSKDEVWAVYADLLGNRLRAAFFDQIRAWCDRQGLLYTGHLLAEDATAKGIRYNGNVLNALKGFSLPGMDEIGTRLSTNDIEWTTFAAAQHAIGRRGKGGLAELFALGPANMTHATQRQMIWLSAMHKVDQYLLAVAPLDVRGNLEKGAYFNPLTRTQPWFPAFRLLADESRLAASYAAKPARCEVAVRYPQTEAAKLSIRGQEHPWLNGTLRRLAIEQITVDLYEEDEACDKPFVISFKGKNIREERSGRAFEKLDELVAFMRAKRPPEVWIERADGKLADSILLRHYQDNNVVALALGKQAQTGLRLVRRGKQPVLFNLPAQGVFIWDGQKPARDIDRRLADPAFVNKNGVRVKPILETGQDAFSLTLENLNMHRLVFNSNGVARLTVEHPVAEARIAMRNFPKPYSLTLDGKPLIADLPCDTLRQGLNGLYMQTAPFSLEKGEHAFSVKTGGKDNNYFLPVAFVTGAFAVKDGQAAAVPQKVGPGALWRHGLAGYSGSVTYQAQVNVPQGPGAIGIRLDTGGLYTSVALNGRKLGERVWAPFEFLIPPDARGGSKQLTITVWTSVAPLFGNWRHADAVWPKNFWVPPADPRPDIGLLAMPEWVFAARKEF